MEMLEDKNAWKKLGEKGGEFGSSVKRGGRLR